MPSEVSTQVLTTWAGNHSPGSQWGFLLDPTGNTCVGYSEPPIDHLAVVAAPVGLINLKILEDNYRLPPALARWAQHVTVTQVIGQGVLQFTTQGKGRHQTAMPPRHYYHLSEQLRRNHAISYRVVRAPAVATLLAVLRPETMQKWLLRTPNLPPQLSGKFMSAITKVRDHQLSPIAIPSPYLTTPQPRRNCQSFPSISRCQPGAKTTVRQQCSKIRTTQILYVCRR